IGALAPGMCADFITFNLDRPGFAGAQVDPVAAVVLCECNSVDHSFIHGRAVVEAGQLVTAELPRLVEDTNRVSRALVCG
ncbi:MAG: 8-oxoguanine deaminase, partial [Opitutaceae bacterium]